MLPVVTQQCSKLPPVQGIRGSGHGVGPQRGWSWAGSAKVAVKGWVHQMEEPNDRITRQLDLGGGLSGGVVKGGAIRNAWSGGSEVLLTIH